MSECLDTPQIFSTGNAVISNTQQMWVQTQETSALLWEKNKVPLMSATSIKAIPSTILENPTWISVHELAATVDSQAVLRMLLAMKVSVSRFLPWEVIVWTWIHHHIQIAANNNFIYFNNIHTCIVLYSLHFPGGCTINSHNRFLIFGHT